MTYCLGIKVKAGLIAIADTRLTSGTETTTARKYYIHQKDKHSLFIMTSGLRSIRDKALTYFTEVLANEDSTFDKLYKAVNAFGDQLKLVSEEDRYSLQQAGLSFDLHTIVGGQLEKDSEQKLYLLYPEGNWIEIGEGSPFIIIGNSGYGKPILSRVLKYDSSLEFALKTGYLSFDATRVCANNVGFPLDVLIYHKNSYDIMVERFEEKEVGQISSLWEEYMKESIHKIPEEWMDKALRHLSLR